MIEQVINWIVSTVGAWGYPGIVVMMALQSSFFPFPSEIVMPPAGYLAYQGEMNFFVAIFMGVLGSCLGALLNYYLAVFFGRRFLLKYGKYFFVTETKLKRVEDFVCRHGEIGIFTGMLIPLLRQYISFPAGLARMKLSHFLFFVALGAAIWMTTLVSVGYMAGHSEELIRQHLQAATLWVVAGCAALLIVYIYCYRRKMRRKQDTEPAP